MKLVVIIPAWNEAPTIADVVHRVPRAIDGVSQTEVLVVDDGSTDGTAALARQAGAGVISHPTNRGVGMAFRTGLEWALRAGADLIVNIDGDGQFAAEDIPKLLEPILAGRAAFVTCTRFGDPALVPAMPRLKRWGNRVLARWISRITGQRLTDVSCGFRAYSREAALKLNLHGRYTYTQETFIDLAGKGVAMAEVALRVRGEREFGRSRVAGNLWRYALRAGSILLRAVRDNRPLTVFGGIGLVVFLLGVVCGLFVFGWWCATGRTSPFHNVLLGSAAFLLLGFLLIVLALLADMLGRMRRTQEQILYLLRTDYYERLSGATRPGTADQPEAAAPPEPGRDARPA